MLFVSFPLKVISQEAPKLQHVYSVQDQKVAEAFNFDREVTRLAAKYNVDETLARRIIKCESSGDPNAVHDNGRLGLDYGYWQINLFYNLSRAKSRGFDVLIPSQNLEYGFWLLSTEKTNPWQASKHCWNK